MSHEPVLTTATIINAVVSDLLLQKRFAYAHFPELVDIAVVGTGLGMLRNNLNFVVKTASFWDTTKWQIAPKPFLDAKSLAYANAIAAWMRGEKDPAWARDLIVDVKAPMKKTLKYLFKTNDSFVKQSSDQVIMPERTQCDWLADANSSSNSTQAIAMRYLQLESSGCDDQRNVIMDRLRSSNRAILLQTVEATQRIELNDESGAEIPSAHLQPIVSELQLLSENKDDEVRAKAMCSLTRLGKIDENTTLIASKMLDSRVDYVTFAGLLGLSSLDSVPDYVIPPANNAFRRSLQACNYEFIGLFTRAFDRWLDDPKSHFETLLAESSPEYLQIATEALENVREQMVALEHS